MSVSKIGNQSKRFPFSLLQGSRKTLNTDMLRQVLFPYCESLAFGLGRLPRRLCHDQSAFPENCIREIRGYTQETRRSRCSG